MKNNLRIATIGLLSAALLSACGAPNLGPPQNKEAELITAVTGTLNGVAAGVVAKAPIEGLEVTTTTTENGHFSFALPNAAQMAPVSRSLNDGFLKDFNCQTALVSTDTSVQVYAFGSVNSGGRDYMDIKAARPTLSPQASLGGRVYLYSTKKAVITGTLTCSLSPLILKDIRANISVNPGWNVLGIEGKNGGFSALTTVTGELYGSKKDENSVWSNTDQLRSQAGI